MSRSLTTIQLGETDYDDAFLLQRELAAAVACSGGGYLVLLSHPPVVTVGRRGTRKHLLVSAEEMSRRGVLLREIDRGGDVTFHGPGQIVGYPIVDLRERARDIHAYLRDIESVIIKVLDRFSIRAGRQKGLTGVWAQQGKLAAIGVAIRRWITYHGFALNVNTDLDYFNLIVPCGIKDREVTSMATILGSQVDEQAVRGALVEEFALVFDFPDRLEIRAESAGEVRSTLDLPEVPAP